MHAVLWLQTPVVADNDAGVQGVGRNEPVYSTGIKSSGGDREWGGARAHVTAASDQAALQFVRRDQRDQHHACDGSHVPDDKGPQAMCRV